MKEDKQQDMVYAAQFDIGGPDHIIGKYIRNVFDVNDYVQNIIATQWWMNRWPCIMSIRVADGRGSEDARAKLYYKYGRDIPLFHGVIHMPIWSRSEGIILHEIAHIITCSEEVTNCSEYEHHGPEFTSNLILLYKRWLGNDWTGELREAFKASNVKYKR